MQIIVNGADWSNTNLGKVQVLGVKNYNVGEGTESPSMLKALPATNLVPAVLIETGVNNPIEQNYVHNVKFDSVNHAQNVQRAFYMTGDVNIGNPNTFQMGFWINAKYYELGRSAGLIPYISISATHGASNAVANNTNIFVPGTYNMTIESGQSSYITSETIVVSHLAEATINGDKWIYVNLKFIMEWGTPNRSVGFNFRTRYFEQYMNSQSMSELIIPICGLILTTSDNELNPYYVYPFVS